MGLGRTGPGCSNFGLTQSRCSGNLGIAHLLELFSASYIQCIRAQNFGPTVLGPEWQDRIPLIVPLSEYDTDPTEYVENLSLCSVVFDGYAPPVPRIIHTPEERWFELSAWLNGGGKLFVMCLNENAPSAEQVEILDRFLEAMGSTIRHGGGTFFTNTPCPDPLNEHILIDGDYRWTRNMPSPAARYAGRLTGGDGVTFRGRYNNEPIVAQQQIGEGVIVVGASSTLLTPATECPSDPNGCLFLNLLANMTTTRLMDRIDTPPKTEEPDSRCRRVGEFFDPGFYCVVIERGGPKECQYYDSDPVGLVHRRFAGPYENLETCAAVCEVAGFYCVNTIIDPSELPFCRLYRTGAPDPAQVIVFSGPHTEPELCEIECAFEDGWYCVDIDGAPNRTCQFLDEPPPSTTTIITGPYETFDECAGQCTQDQSGWYCVILALGQPRQCVFFNEYPGGSVVQVLGGPYEFQAQCNINCEDAP